jgi:citrate lyase subunit beta/citryl-CoA lyase
MQRINPLRLRSVLIIPSIKKKFFAKLFVLEGDSKPDGVIFDLEDSVHPDFKEQARENLREFLGNEAARKEVFSKYVVFIRANSFRTEYFEEDMRLVKEIRPHFLVLPKAESAEELETSRKLGMCQLFVAIESLKGIDNINSILGSMEPHDLFAIGYEDLSAEIGIERPENLNSINLLTNILLHSLTRAKKHNIAMIDVVSRKFSEKDLASFREECLFTSNLGLSGKVCIHPNQIPIVNEVWGAKSRLMQERAKRVLEKFGSLADGSSVIVNESKEMMDTPSYRMYAKLLSSRE